MKGMLCLLRRGEVKTCERYSLMSATIGRDDEAALGRDAVMMLSLMLEFIFCGEISR